MSEIDPAVIERAKQLVAEEKAQAGSGDASPSSPAPPQPPESVAAAAEAAPPAQPEPPAPVPEATPAAASTGKEMDADWPRAGYTGPQPWEADNTPELTQNHLMVSSGSAGPEVIELAALLGALGYTTTIGTGQNPVSEYDVSVADAVRQFCTDYGVAEDPAVLRARTEDTVGPWIWEALTRAVGKKREAAAADQEKAQA